MTHSINDLSSIKYNSVIDELKKIAQAVEKEVGKPPTSIVGLLGELMVLRKMFSLGLNPVYISRQKQPDIILLGKKIEIKTSHVNNYRKETYCSGNANIDTDKFDKLILVSISKNWDSEKYFIFNKKDVPKIKLEKRSYGERENLVEIRYYEEPLTKEHFEWNKRMKKHLEKWKKLIMLEP
jgi:hypothetical protein